MRVISFVVLSFIGTAVLGQNPPPAEASKPAAPKPAATKAAPKPAQPPSQVDAVIESVKAGLSESLIIRTLQRDNKPANLTTADLVKLKNAGVSENIINVLLDPGSAPAAAAAPAAPAPVAAAAPPPPPTPPPPPAPAAAAAAPAATAPTSH